MKNFRIVALGLFAVVCSSSHFKPAASLSLSFEENRGQAPTPTQLLARGQGYNIAFTPQGNQLMIRRGSHGLSMGTNLVGADPKTIVRGEQMQIGKVNYFRSSSTL